MHINIKYTFFTAMLKGRAQSNFGETAILIDTFNRTVRYFPTLGGIHP